MIPQRRQFNMSNDSGYPSSEELAAARKKAR
jgi:hypothetical protein